MNATFNRREFLSRTTGFGLACACGCSLALVADAEEPASKSAPGPSTRPLRSRAYCGLICNDRCPLRKATVAEDATAKKAVFEKWKWHEKFGVEFDPAKVFCYGCKPDGKPRSIAMNACTVRSCATDRGLESCLQCTRLAECDKDLWQNSPDFRKRMQKVQAEYVTAGVFTLV
jgi:hypothetical protein